MNEKTPGFCFSGFLIIMLMPRFMNGLVKSTSCSRSAVIVSGAIAMCASYTLATDIIIIIIIIIITRMLAINVSIPNL